MKNNTKNYIIGGVVLLLIVLTISVSYAYFHARILGNDEALENSFKVGKLELSFVDDNYISLLNVKPGSSDSKTFSVENTSTLDDPITYNIKLSEITNNFVRRDLKYTLEEYPDASFETPKEDGLKVEGYINTDSVQNNEMYLAVNIPGPVKGAKQYYKLTIDFQELNMPQDYNQNASFEGKVNVDSEEDMKLYVQEPNAPELYQGMIPVYFNDGKIYIANVDAKWYDYDNNEWANAVLINYTDPTTKAKFYDGDKLKINQEVSEDDILQMYVWIPRYRYKLFNANAGDSVEKQLIDIEFEKDTETTGNVSCTYTDMKNGTVLEDCKNAENGNWYTHPAFTFGNTELKGFWVGKFEPSDAEDEIGKNSNIGEITILPNKTSMSTKTVSTIFNATRDIELEKSSKYNLNVNEIDTHTAKNSEWGAVAYLTQSVYGIYKDKKTCNIEGMPFDTCEVWINNTVQGTGDSGMWKYGGTYTGCVGESVNAAIKYNTKAGTVAECDPDKQWNTGGVKASTTGNMYGVYDMVGGDMEYVMGATVNQTGGGLYLASSGFQSSSLPESKYYDLYTFDDENTTQERGHLGDATREILLTYGNDTGGWNGDYTRFSAETSSERCPWIARGGCYFGDNTAGVFAFFWAYGGTNTNHSFRSVLSAA